MNPEQERLQQSREKKKAWKYWGPYLSERQWGTVREDYSQDGNAWDYFSHDQSRSRAYRWGEDGLAGISDESQLLCWSVALWNGKDPILKERLFGLTNSEGNHGEDVKEYYFYLDSTPTHSYMKYLYKYPHLAYPYDDLVATNRQRSREEMEYELLDTGVFNEDRYFDVFVEYAKESPEDILIQIRIVNRGSDSAPLHVLPTLWFRNTWSWIDKGPKPVIQKVDGYEHSIVHAYHTDELFKNRLGDYYLYCEGLVPLLFTENETNTERLFGSPNPFPYVKDGINNVIVGGQNHLVNPILTGTKVAAHYQIEVPGGATQVVRLRLTHNAPTDLTVYPEGNPFGSHYEQIFSIRKQEADEFYATVIPPSVGEDGANVMRQALAGMLWSKQFYYYDLNKWLQERGANPFEDYSQPAPRNGDWHHMYNSDIISMPDKWEYPWFAAWDLAFHVITLSMVDADFGKEQLELMLQERYIHPNGQMAAYEWNFGDVNPPVQAWATIFTYKLEKARSGKVDVHWLERSFQKLLLNFTWWINRKDRMGKNLFEGGFLGLDNIGIFDRSSPLPTGGYLEQADGTAWMALFCQNMLDMAGELAASDPAYEDMVLKFLQHVLFIGHAMYQSGGGGEGMWDEEDGFFYDVLRLPDGSAQRLKVRSMVGLLPLCAATFYDNELIANFSEANRSRFNSFLEARPKLLTNMHNIRKPGHGNSRLISIVDETKLRRILSIMLDEKEFLSPYGLRSLSRYHAEHPYILPVGGVEYRVDYLPAESNTGMFGGNSNWRGPIWMPVNVLIVRALLNYYGYYGNEFKVECPTGSGQMMTLYEVAAELSRRLANIFLRDDKGYRPVYGGTEKFQTDPHWRDYIFFYEYFHGDNGAGLGANHQTGWTGSIARLMQLFAVFNPDELLKLGRPGAFQQIA